MLRATASNRLRQFLRVATKRKRASGVKAIHRSAILLRWSPPSRTRKFGGRRSCEGVLLHCERNRPQKHRELCASFTADKGSQRGLEDCKTGDRNRPQMHRTVLIDGIHSVFERKLPGIRSGLYESNLTRPGSGNRVQMKGNCLLCYGRMLRRITTLGYIGS